MKPGDPLPLNLGRRPLGSERSHYREDGSVKASWASSGDAKRVERRKRDGRPKLNVYRCQWCSMWHAGGTPRGAV